MVCERLSILAAFGGDKICLLSSRLLPAAYWVIQSSHVSAIVPNLVLVQLLGQFLRASPSVLEIKKCFNS